MDSELQPAGGDEGRSSTTGLQVTPEVLSMTSELQGSGGDEGRSSSKGLQVTPEVLLMTSELQGSGGNEGRSTITGLHVTSECLLMDSEQAKDGTLREPERAQGKPDTDGRRQPSEHVASAVSMAGQVAQQLCPDAGRVALFVARFAEDLGRLAASDKGWNAVELGGESSFEGVWGPWCPVWWCPFYGCEPPNTGAGWEHTAADQGVPGGWGESAYPRACTVQAAAPPWQVAAGTWWPPSGDGSTGWQSPGQAAPPPRQDVGSAASTSAPGALSGGTAVVGEARGSICAGTGGASGSSSRLKNNAFAALASDSEDEEEVEREPVPAVELPVKNGKQDEGGKPQLRQQQQVAAAAVVAAKAPFSLAAATLAGAKVARGATAVFHEDPETAITEQRWLERAAAEFRASRAQGQGELISSTRLLRAPLPGALHFQSLPHVRRAQGWHRQQRVRRLLR